MLINKREYADTKLFVMESLCCDIILGRDFLGQHDSVIFPFAGNGQLVVNSITALKIEPPKIFQNLHDQAEPIATPSRHYSQNHREIISAEINNLLKNDIIESSRSPWRAQVVVVNQGNKNRLVIDLSLIHI